VSPNAAIEKVTFPFVTALFIAAQHESLSKLLPSL